MIDESWFRINDRVARKGDKLANGDRLAFNGPHRWLSTAPLPNPRLRVPVVYEDSELLVVDKPAGVPTHGFSPGDTKTLANFLAAHHPLAKEVGTSRWEHGVAHRLDRDTSGLVLVAKTQAAFENLRRQFRQGRVKKTYWTLVWGLTPRARSVSFSLAHDPADRRRMLPVIDGRKARKYPKSWPALTRFRKLDAAGGFSLLEIEMLSGVTHQIRAHLAAIGHPVAGDTLYGAERPPAPGLQRHFLHAIGVEFAHPRDGRAMKLHAPLPKDLKATLQGLKLKI
jgi:23S rRNA pseudouridine1911/1915/1917 synthase